MEGKHVEYSFLLQSGLDENQLASALFLIGRSIEVMIKDWINLLFIPPESLTNKTHSDRYSLPDMIFNLESKN